MARPQRIEYEGAVYPVTARGNERRAILEDDADQMTQLYGYLYQRSMYAAFYRYRYEDLPPARAIRSSW